MLLLRIIAHFVLALILAATFSYAGPQPRRKGMAEPCEVKDSLMLNVVRLNDRRLEKPEELRFMPGDAATFYFSSQSVLRRLAIRVKEPSQDPLKRDTLRMYFTWNPARPDATQLLKPGAKEPRGSQDTVVGSFNIPRDQALHCVSLVDLGVPDGAQAGEFMLKTEQTTALAELHFSPSFGEATLQSCPDPQIFADLKSSYQRLRERADPAHVRAFVGELKQVVETYDCRRPTDRRPVPAWWMCGSRAEYNVCAPGDPEQWFTLARQSALPEAHEFVNSKEFRNSLPPGMAERLLLPAR